MHFDEETNSCCFDWFGIRFPIRVESQLPSLISDHAHCRSWLNLYWILCPGGSCGGLWGLQPALNFHKQIVVIRVAFVIDLPAWPL